MRYLRVSTEASGDYVDYIPLDNTIDADDEDCLDALASDIFSSHCGYGHSIVDEAEVPENER